jgi:hypothetical protein
VTLLGRALVRLPAAVITAVYVLAAGAVLIAWTAANAFVITLVGDSTDERLAMLDRLRRPGAPR